MNCASCGAENEARRKFCGECGEPLALLCGTCAAPNPPTAKFCGECGVTLLEQPADRTQAARTEHVAERRFVSVLFVDLVGFTTASEGRDSEDTRELLTRYFDLARTTIERYGGTVEKFIGDAVMALWGAPVAHEDDAERAVRAALELVAAVPELHGELQARAGVLTGEAAVTLGAQAQGMVAGDLVNTASRIQSAAAPGNVLVGETTRRTSEAAIAYDGGGLHELKGKTEPVTLWQALRVVAARGGEGRATGLEAPFVGRERELRLVKELFHATAEEGRAHLLGIVGIAGIGKSRLAWEFEKYLDGLVDEAWWHRGRCLAYGDGVAYWALAEMIRWRARIREDEPAEEAVRKLHEVVTEIVNDPDEQAFVEPRLQHLLGLADRVAPDREDLFSAWRLFIERMADRFPVILVFEDIQWADAALIEFVEYLLDWSRGHPVYLVMLARPEVSERHPGWGANLRNFTTLSLEPLRDEAMDALLRGLVPGLPDEAAGRIRERADGIPLYAVETVRMLLDRGLLEPGEGGYRATGDLSTLDVPETLHALISARLDGLEPAERRLLQDAAVLGKTFAPRGLAAIGGTDEETLRPALAALVRKETLVLDTDPRSPERGQYGFVQALIQRIAYETLSRRDRKTKHLAAAAYLSGEAGIEPEEIAEVIATHLLDAYRAEPNDPDATEIKADASGWLVRAGERAAALAATDDAQRSFETAVELADEPLERARLLERAGELARAADRIDIAEEHLRAALSLCEGVGATHDRARVAAALGLALWRRGNIAEAVELLEDAFGVLTGDEPDADFATLAAQLGRLYFFAGDRERAAERIEIALDIGEELKLPAVISAALTTKGLIVGRHPHEADALIRQALRLALDHDLVFEALRAYNNLLVLLETTDRLEQIMPLLEEALSLARRRGDRFWEVRLVAYLCDSSLYDGRWDNALELGETLPLDRGAREPILGNTLLGLTRIAIDREEPARARELLDLTGGELDTADDQRRRIQLRHRQLEAELEGRIDDASTIIVESLPFQLESFDEAAGMGELLLDAAKYATVLNDHAFVLIAASLIDALPANRRTRTVDSQLSRLRANAAAAQGDEAAAADAFAVALANARNLGFAYYLAPVLYDYAAWLASSGRHEEAAPLLAEARELFEGMGATAWLRRLDALEPTPVRT